MNHFSMRMRPARFLLAAILLALAPSCASSPASSAATSRPTASTPVYPTVEWLRSPAPESLGYSSDKLEQVRQQLQGMASTGMMVVVGGKVIFEYGDLDTLSYLASVRKSVLSMLFGNYVASGRIRLDKTLREIGLTDRQGLSELELQATIFHLINARSGIYHPASNSGDDTRYAPPRGSQQPGTFFLYNNWDFNAVGAIFERETGIDIFDALQKDIAEPIGMQDFRRDAQRKQGNLNTSMHPAYHMYLSVRDMARIGYLMLRDGNWNGRQVIPRDWVRTITTPVTRVTEMNPPQRRTGRWGYSHLWWIWDGPRAIGPYVGAYTGLGAVGQHITVLPALDMVLAHKTVPGGNRSVSHEQFMGIVDMVVNARCPGSCR
jgi:CubicO group peptidase (beta-lactamase class C family)